MTLQFSIIVTCYSFWAYLPEALARISRKEGEASCEAIGVHHLMSVAA